MSPVLPKRPRLLDESSSTNWFDLPLEMREMVIDRMDPKTRCIFAQCSKICEKEAKKSNNYLNSISLSVSLQNEIDLQLRISNSSAFQGAYLLEFVDVGENRTSVSYVSETRSGRITKWTKVELGKPKDVRWKYFNEYLEKYKHSIRYFFSNDTVTSIKDFNIKNLKKLEELILVNRETKDKGGMNIVDCGFVELKQLISIKKLELYDYDLAFEQLVALKAKDIQVTSQNFNKENMNKYLKIMKKGEIQGSFWRVCVDFGFQNRIDDDDVPNIIMGLDVFDYARSEPDPVNDLIETAYTFNFLSDVNRNVMFRVKLKSCFIMILGESTVSL